ncbi:MAG: hypothetical protein ABWY45_17365 [Mycobacterium sp.]
MAMIRSALQLHTLQIRLAPRRDRLTEAMFQVVRGDEPPSEVARCRLGDLGLPNALIANAPVDDEKLIIPDGILARLVTAIAGLGPSPASAANVLWLEFPSPRGFLYIVPWERLLAPLGRRILRVPNHMIRPHTPQRVLEVAICTSAPMAKERFNPVEALQPIIEQYKQASPHRVAIHVFTDSESYRSVAQHISDHGNVVVHNPADAAGGSLNRSSAVNQEARTSNPWLIWIRDALKGRALDFVHFVGHGFMSGDQGALAVALSPTAHADRGLSQLIGSAELNVFLGQVGAWGLVLSGPYRNYSDVGLRELADSIVQNRPGLAITHDQGRDGDSTQLGRILQRVLNPSFASDEALPAITCWVHPTYVDYPGTYCEELHLDSDGSSTFIAARTRHALADEGTAGWVASATRVLETHQMRWLPDSADEATDNAAVTALRNVADLVERHVAQTYGEGP